ncbi:MAG: enoyl-CoA hydratase/isomerase family protein [Thalassovita sp.]
MNTVLKDHNDTLLIERPSEHVFQVTFNRPERRNAMNTAMGRDLLEWFETLSLQPNQARCVVLTGAGDKAFCAGGDLKERNGMTDDQWVAQHLVYERLTRAILYCPVPVIAAVNGAAFGGGTELASNCDFIYAAASARFALTETSLGIMPGSGGTQQLSRAVGMRRAKELILSAKPFSAHEAAEWGLVNKVLPDEELIPATLEVARSIAGNAPIATRQAKQSISRGYDMSIGDGLAFEIEAYNRMIPTEDRQEGVRAFNEKRSPEFKGR